MAKKEELRQEEWLKEKVTVRLFKDSGKYQDDLHVAVNGKMWVIQRGKDVTIPRYVWLVIEESLKQDSDTATMIANMSK